MRAVGASFSLPRIHPAKEGANDAPEERRVSPIESELAESAGRLAQRRLAFPPPAAVHPSGPKEDRPGSDNKS